MPYSSFAQRPHRFVAFFNRHTRGRTLWIDPYPGRLPRLADLERTRPRTCPHVEEALEVVSPPIWAADPAMALPSIRRLVWKPVLERVEAFTEGADWLLVIGRPSRLALHLLRRTGPRPTCYDAMDDFPEFYSGLARALSRRIEDEIAHGVDDILASSTALQDKFGRRGLAAELLPNGLRTCPKALEPEPGDARDELVLGYVGTIGDWFDWPLVVEMALSLPEARFEITGPEMVAPKTRLPANVHRAGECAEHEVFGRLRSFIAGLIPFKLNREPPSTAPSPSPGSAGPAPCPTCRAARNPTAPAPGARTRRPTPESAPVKSTASLPSTKACTWSSIRTLSVCSVTIILR